MVEIKSPVDVEIGLEAAISDFLNKSNKHKLIIEIKKEKLRPEYHSSFGDIKQEIAHQLEQHFGRVTNHQHIPYFSLEVPKKKKEKIKKHIEGIRFGRNVVSKHHLYAIHGVVNSQVRYIPEAVTPYLPVARKPHRKEKKAIKMEGLYNLGQMGAYLAHERGYQGQGVNIAIVDTGVNYLHQEFHGRFAGGYDFVENKSDPMDQNRPCYHGTHVAGTALGSTTGVAPQSNLYALRVLNKEGFGFESDIIEAFMWCLDNNIHVVNCSFGSTHPSDTEERALDLLINRHHIGACAAAGNQGKEMVTYPKGYPIEGLIGVAAVNPDNSHADFSNIHITNDISAYGVEILSASKGNSYKYLQGTSMATPHVTGLYALIKSHQMNITPGKAESLIMENSQPLGARDYFGAGLARADKSVGKPANRHQRILNSIFPHKR